MTHVPSQRLAAQALAGAQHTSPAELVSYLGAVQAQDYAACKWALGLRLGNTSEAAMETAIARGAVIRMHAFRFTWQLLAPRDVRWILDLVRPTLMRRSARRLEALELDAATLRRCHKILEKALAEQALTRAELTVALQRAKISITGERLSHILGLAELQGLICAGPRAGKQPTYVLLERVLQGRAHAPADPLGTIASRYFRSRGPATLDDFTWWTGLPKGECGKALASLKGQLVRETIDGREHWRSDAAGAEPEQAYLLPAFDEYLVAYKDRSAVLAPAQVSRVNAGGGMLSPCIVHSGRVIGTWRREVKKDAVVLALSPFRRLTRAQRQAVQPAADRYGAFLGLPVRFTR